MDYWALELDIYFHFEIYFWLKEKFGKKMPDFFEG